MDEVYHSLDRERAAAATAAVIFIFMIVQVSSTSI